MTAASRPPTTTRQAGHQSPSDDCGGDETADPTMASLTRASVLDHASVDLGARCRRRRRMSLNSHTNVLVWLAHCSRSTSIGTIQRTCMSKWQQRSAARLLRARQSPEIGSRQPGTWLR